MYLFIFRERGRDGERAGEKHQCVVAFRVPPTGDLARNPGMYPDWESNWQPFALQAGTQCIELHQPGLTFKCIFFPVKMKLVIKDIPTFNYRQTTSKIF